MLTKGELREYEKVVGFNLWQVEKDYLQHLFLLFLYARIGKELILKGGTALQKVFGLNRFSVDLDFALMDNELEKALERVAKDITTFGFPSKLSKIEETEVAKTAWLKIEGPLYDGSEKTITNLRLEISLRKDLILKPLVKEVVPVYRDLRPYAVVIMDLREIMAEKIRAIAWRSRARDLYDLWFLLRKNVKLDPQLVNRKLEYYNLKFDKRSFLQKIRDLKDVWKLELTPLVSWLPPFEVVEKDVHTFLGKDPDRAGRRFNPARAR